MPAGVSGIRCLAVAWLGMLGCAATPVGPAVASYAKGEDHNASEVRGCPIRAGGCSPSNAQLRRELEASIAFEQRQRVGVSGTARTPGGAKAADDGWYDPVDMTMFLWGKSHPSCSSDP
jgi:hypothetical protein